MTSALRSIGRNTAWLLVQNLANKLISFLITAYLARQLGVGGFGTLATILSFVMTIAVFSDMGLSMYTVRSIAASPHLAARWFGTGMFLTGGLVSLTFCATLGVAWAMGAWVSLPLVAMLSGGTLLSLLANYAGAYAQGLGRMEVLAVGELVYRVALLIGCVLAVTAGWGLPGIGAAYLVSGFLMLAGTLKMLIPRLFRPAREVDGELLWSLLGGSWVYALGGLIILVHLNAGVLLSARWAGAAAAGYFSSASSLMFAVRILPGLLLRAAFPTLTRRISENPAEIVPLNTRTLRYTMLVMLPISVGGALLAPQIVLAVFGGKFLAAAPIAQVLLGGVWLMSLNNASGYMFFSMNRIQAATGWAGLILALQLLLALRWIPAYGALGAAWALVVSEAVGQWALSVYLGLLYKSPFPWLAAMRCGVASLLMGALVWYLRPVLNMAALIGAGGATYWLLLLLLGEWGEEERRIFSGIFRKGAL